MSCLEALQCGRVGIGAQAIGIGEAALALGLAHARERQLFGRRLSDLQASRFSLADWRLDTPPHRPDGQPRVARFGARPG